MQAVVIVHGSIVYYRGHALVYEMSIGVVGNNPV